MDEDFKVYFNDIKEKENLKENFTELDNLKKLEILMTMWFIVIYFAYKKFS